MTSKIINKGRAFIQHGDNVITLLNPMSTANFLSILTIHLPRLFDMDVTTRGPGHSPGAFPAGMQTTSGNMTITTRPSSNSVTGTNTRLMVRLHGGYGYISGDAAPLGTTERYDDIANTQVARTVLNFARGNLATFSLNGFGYTTCGNTGAIVGTTERFDEVINSQVQRTNATPTWNTTGYALNGFGFKSGGTGAAGVNEKFDDVTNSWETRAIITDRNNLSGYGLNGYGFTSGGFAAAVSGITQRFDDNANIQLTRASLNTARLTLAGYSINGYGFTNCGFLDLILTATGIVERFDDIANTQTNRQTATARGNLATFSLNGFGFTSCGFTNPPPLTVDTTERFDDVANTQTGVTAATARTNPGGYSTNEYFVNYRCYNE